MSLASCDFRVAHTSQGQYHSFLDYPSNYPAPGIIVPQQVFTPPPAQAIPQGQQFPIVRFAVNGAPGVSLAQARAGQFTGLTQTDNNLVTTGDANTIPHLTNNAAYRISIRILVSPVPMMNRSTTQSETQWPGYPPWFYQLHVADNQLNPFSLGRLTGRIASVVERFLEVIVFAKRAVSCG